MSIYKPSLLDKFKDFVNGLRSNWDKYEDHVAEFDAHLADYATITSMEFPLEMSVKVNTARIMKIGKVVNLTIGIKKTDGSVFAPGYSLIIGQLPVGYRPAHSIIVPAGLGDDEWKIQDAGYVYIATDGRISVTNHVSSTARVLYFTTTFIVP